MTIGLVYDPYMKNHCSEKHPESPERITSIYKCLLDAGYIDKMIAVKSRSITDDELLRIHNQEYVHDTKFLLSGPNNSIKKFSGKYNSIFANKYTLDCALLAAGCCAEIAKEISLGNINSGFALVRPPGHHAYTNKASGFCIFNNACIAAKTALDYVQKVYIIDFDIHHGDGTQDIINKKFNNNEIQFISIHRHDNGTYYPGTGKEINSENILNIPLNGDSGTNEIYLTIFEKIICNNVKQFNPDVIIVSAGYDAAVGDPLGGYNLTPECYKTMVKMLKNITPKILLILEGGYNLNSISLCAKASVEALLE